MKNQLYDMRGFPVAPGDFVYLVESIGPLVSGPNRLLDCRCGAIVLQIGTFTFRSSERFLDRAAKLNHWKHWHDKRHHFEKFCRHILIAAEKP